MVLFTRAIQNIARRSLPAAAAAARRIITVAPASTATARRLSPVSSSCSTATTAIRSLASSSAAASAGGALLAALKAENPYTDVVQYTHKNQIFSISTVDYNSEALAIGIAENGLISGDVVLSWLPQHFSEQMILQFACSKAGFVLYWLDPAMAVTDPTKAQRALEAALKLTKANVLVSQEAGSDVNYCRLAEAVVPELRIFDFTVGMPFLTPRFPDLRFCIHTGFDQEDKWGWLPLRHMLVPSDNLDSHVDTTKITGATPLAGELILDKDGIPVSIGKTLSNEQVHAKRIWPTYSNVLDRKFHEVEGVGVIF